MDDGPGDWFNGDRSWWRTKYDLAQPDVYLIRSTPPGFRCNYRTSTPQAGRAFRRPNTLRSEIDGRASASR